MHKNLKYSIIIISLLMSVVFLPSCKNFLNPDQELNITKDKLYDDWYEYRSIAMGLYGLQQKLVEQLVVLGELRGDLLTVTPNADADLMEIYNFQASKTNKYADPTNFYKLISACNSFISELKQKHPEVLDKKVAVSNYDKLYGEALCMRTWAYFNAVRIYGKVPVIYESLTSIEEIEKYLNSTSYIDSVHFALRPGVTINDGYPIDTTYTKITLKKQFYNLDQVVSVFSKELEENVKAVGVNHYIDNGDNSWEVTVWNTFAWHTLLGQMYLTTGDLAKAASHLNAVAFTTSEDYRYQLDQTFSNGQWRNIFTGIDRREHIFTLYFNKANQQQNDFQRLFEPFEPNQYMLKPTKAAILLWETIWRGYNLILNVSKPEFTKLDKKPADPLKGDYLFKYGIPSDFYRGFGTSYYYVKNGKVLSQLDYFHMLYFKMNKDEQSLNTLMDGVDTIVNKYSIDKTRYDQDANFIVYRAGSIQLYLAEIYTWWAYEQSGFIKTFTTNAVSILNNGSNYSSQALRQQLGVLGRVGLWGTYSEIQLRIDNSAIPFSIPAYTGTFDGISVGNINYIHDPYTNEITGYTDLTDNLLAKQLYLEENILDERARELAFEGERFYDLVRVAKRRNDPSFLAKKVSAKYPASMRQSIYNKLLIEKNWYINIFD